ncbi:MAG TPA: SLBB domain-containing protein [Gemmatimonadaceae bacterium]|nr:SLBB domain-containing protein [Gemmatimonadaceae bacterium]
MHTDMSSTRRLLSIRPSRLGTVAGVLFGILTLPIIAGTAGGQTTSTAPAKPIPTPASVSPQRATLTEAAENFEKAARTEKNANKRAEYLWQAQVIRKRLAEGDFQTGHRILLFIAGDSALSDTFTVMSDQKLQLPNLPEISLAGILDSELQGYLATQLAKYIRDPSVRAQALLRVQVTGDVAKPGFYSIRTDTPVTDVVMNAGGPSQNAEMGKIELRRGSTTVVHRGGIQTAIQKELTMSDIGARSGDELYVPTKPGTSRWQKLAAITASVMGIVWAVAYLTNR